MLESSIIKIETNGCAISNGALQEPEVKDQQLSDQWIGSNTERAKSRSVKKYCLQQDVTHGKIRMLYALQLGECEKLTECEKSLPFTASWTCPSDLIHH